MHDRQREAEAIVRSVALLQDALIELLVKDVEAFKGRGLVSQSRIQKELDKLANMAATGKPTSF